MQRTTRGFTFQPGEGGLATGLGSIYRAHDNVWLRRAGGEWQLFREGLRASWKADIRPVLDLYLRRPPGAAIEEKDYSLAWHYRRADAGLGAQRARELLSHLRFMTSNTDLQVLEGHKVLEVKSAAFHKGTAAARWLAPGDDQTDEDTFAALPPEAYTVRVGWAPRSLARYAVAGVAEVRQLLQGLLETVPARVGG